MTQRLQTMNHIHCTFLYCVKRLNSILFAVFHVWSITGLKTHGGAAVLCKSYRRRSSRMHLCMHTDCMLNPYRVKKRLCCQCGTGCEDVGREETRESAAAEKKKQDAAAAQQVCRTQDTLCKVRYLSLQVVTSKCVVLFPLCTHTHTHTLLV